MGRLIAITVSQDDAHITHRLCERAKELGLQPKIGYLGTELTVPLDDA